MAAERVSLAVAPGPLLIEIYLVAGHDDDATHRWHRAHCFEQLDRAQEIGGERVDGPFVRPPDERLGREVKLDLRLCLPNRADDVVAGTYVQIARLRIADDT